jgi:hypothetical protein
MTYSINRIYLKYPYFHVINQLLVTAMSDQAPDPDPNEFGSALR